MTILYKYNHNKIKVIVYYYKERNLIEQKIRILTNGTILTDKILKTLITYKNDIKLKISLHTSTNKKLMSKIINNYITIKDQGVNISIQDHSGMTQWQEMIKHDVVNNKIYPSNENEALIFDNVNKHSGIVQTDTQTRIVLNIATE